MKKRHLLKIAAMLLSLTLLLIPSTAYGKANGHTWPRRDQYINFYIPANSNMFTADERNEVVAAFRTWREVNYTNNYFWHLSLMTTTNSSAPNKIIKPDHWPYSYRFAGYTEFNESNGVITSVEIYLNNSKGLVIGASSGKYDLRSIVIHEAGHVLGVAHCHEEGSTCGTPTCEKNAMNPNARINSIQGRTLQEYDKASYMAVYFKTASETSTSRIAGMDYFTERQRILKEALSQ